MKNTSKKDGNSFIETPLVAIIIAVILSFFIILLRYDDKFS